MEVNEQLMDLSKRTTYGSKWTTYKFKWTTYGSKFIAYRFKWTTYGSKWIAYRFKQVNNCTMLNFSLYFCNTSN